MVQKYSLQESQGRYTITVPADSVRAKGWEKGEDLSWKISGSKLKLVDGDDYTLQRSQDRFFVTCPLAEKLGWEKGEELTWSIDGNGRLELSKP